MDIVCAPAAPPYDRATRGRGGTVDTPALGAGALTSVGVRIPPPAQSRFCPDRPRTGKKSVRTHPPPREGVWKATPEDGLSGSSVRFASILAPSLGRIWATDRHAGHGIGIARRR